MVTSPAQVMEWSQHFITAVFLLSDRIIRYLHSGINTQISRISECRYVEADNIDKESKIPYTDTINKEMSKTGRRSSPQTGKWESKEFRASQGRKNHSAVSPAPEKGMEKAD